MDALASIRQLSSFSFRAIAFSLVTGVEETELGDFFAASTFGDQEGTISGYAA